jgi:plastocyanin
MRRTHPIAGLLLASLFTAACGGESAPAGGSTAGGSTPQVASGPAQGTGDVVEVQMISQPGQGEKFEAPTVTVKRGDVLRFTLVSGVHNASFPANRNPGGVQLPPATPYLQAPGQTHDVPIDLPPGEYHYQCDPHVALGMVGTLIVTD